METLFAKVALLLTGTMLMGAFGTLCGRRVQSLGGLIALLVGFVLGTIAVIVAANINPVVGIILLMGWAYLSGLVIGPSVEMYSQKLGWQTVCGAFLGTAGVMAGCGAYGLLTTANLSGWGTYLGFGLFGLIIVGVIGIFVRMSRTVNIVYSLFGMVIFAGYFVYDFFRLGHSENTWAKAVELTMSIYLDFLNFFLYLLQFLAAVSDKN
jgi:FtsH-binding integral membrane protein